MADEQVILDPSEVATGRSELDITPWIDQEGIDWGNAEIEAYMAEAERGMVPVDYRIPNRQIQGALKFKGTLGGTTTVTARANIQAKLALFQREGGWLKRVTNSGGTVFADVVNATLQATSVAGWESARSLDLDAQFTLECVPDFYGAEQTLSDHVETSAAELVFTETSILGDYPGRVRVVVDEDDAETQLGLLWGVRSRNYSSASTARLAYEAEALQALDTAAAASLSGASGGTAVTHGTLATSWTPVVGTNIGGTSYMTHVGTYRVWARVYTSTAISNSGDLDDATFRQVKVRLAWDTGDLVFPEENQEWTFPASSQFFVADLGEVRLRQVPVGTHRWQGQVQAKGSRGGESVSIDRVWFQPLDEAAGRLRAPVDAPVLSSWSARDEFNQAVTGGSDPLTGLSAPVGGAWAGAGDADDFVVEDDGHTAQRTATSDTGAGRLAVVGSNQTETVVQVDLKTSVLGSDAIDQPMGGPIVRYVDASNYLACRLQPRHPDSTAGGVGSRVTLAGFVAGFPTLDQTFSLARVASDTWYTVRIMVDAAGKVFVWVVEQGQPLGEPNFLTQSSIVATGGALASGKPGIVDYNPSTTVATRNYDNFLNFVPNHDAVINASQSLELRHDGHFREDSTGTAYGPVSWVEGDLARIPPSGSEGRTVEWFFKASRGDFDQIPDSGIDDISARVNYRASYLFVP